MTNKDLDIIFQIALMISSPLYNLRDLEEEDKAKWVARQLEGCGYKLREAGGMAWYKLDN